MIRIAKTGNQVLGGVEEFEWSSAEQVWPFEKDRNGETLYAKEINFGFFPHIGNKGVAHGISNLGYMHNIIVMSQGYGQNTFPISFPDNGWRALYDDGTHINITTTGAWSSVSAYVRLIYTKTA